LLGAQLSADLAGLVDRVTVVRSDSHPNVVATWTVAVAITVTGAVGVSAGVRSRWIRWAPNFLPRTAVAPLAITDASPHATRQGRRSDNHHDCRAEKQFLHDALPLAPPQDSLGIQARRCFYANRIIRRAAAALQQGAASSARRCRATSSSIAVEVGHAARLVGRSRLTRTGRARNFACAQKRLLRTRAQQ